jgi:hypothetical protein
VAELPVDGPSPISVRAWVSQRMGSSTRPFSAAIVELISSKTLMIRARSSLTSPGELMNTLTFWTVTAMVRLLVSL